MSRGSNTGDDEENDITEDVEMSAKEIKEQLEGVRIPGSDINSHDRVSSDASDVDDVVNDSDDDPTDEEIRAHGEASADASDNEDDESDTDDDGYIRNSDGIRVGVTRDVDDMIISPDEGEFRCTVCSAATSTAHGMKSHFGSKHPDTDADKVDRLLEAEQKSADWEDGMITSDASNDTSGESNNEGKWVTARNTYTESRSQASPLTRSHARDAVVDALEAETDWMSIVERCDETTYDLWHLTEDGWEKNGYKYCEMRMRDELGSTATDTEVGHIVAQLATANYVKQENTNAKHLDESLVPVLNGVINVDDIEYDADSMTIDWDTVEVQEMEPNRHRFLYRVQTDWDPENADMEGLDEWLETITRNDEARRIIWEFAGHALHPRYPVDGMLVFLGDGGSGKSQTLEVVKAMLGGDNVSVKTMNAIQNERFAGKDVVDSRANINTELTGKKLQSINKLKTYTAGEEDSVEGKGTAAFKSKNDATMTFASDDPPAFPQDNKALGRRLYPIEFPYSYEDDPDPDKKFELQSRPKLKVQEELQADKRLKAALMRALDGLVRLLREGNFTSSMTWQERVAKYESYADPVHDFARNVLVSDVDAAIETSDMKATFDTFADDKGHDGKTMSQISDILEEMPAYPISKNRTRSFADDNDRHTIYEGVAFTDEAKSNWVPESAHWDIYETDDETDDEADIARETLKEIREDSELGRREGVKVKIASSTEKTSYNRHEEGVLRDDTDTIRYYVQPNGISLEEGETYVIRDVATIEEDGETKLQLIPGMTDVLHVERGTDDDQDDLNDDDGDDVVSASDDDTHDRVSGDTRELDLAIIDASDIEKSTAGIAGKVSATVDTNNLDTIKGRIEKLKARGDIVVAGESDANDVDDTIGSDRVSGDPDRPAVGRMSETDVQCRSCGKWWPLVSMNGRFEGHHTECKSCGETIDVEWNIQERKLNPEYLPDGFHGDGEEA